MRWRHPGPARRRRSTPASGATVRCGSSRPPPTAGGARAAISWNTVGPSTGRDAGQSRASRAVTAATARRGRRGRQARRPIPTRPTATLMVTGQKQGAFSQTPIDGDGGLARDRLAARRGVGPADRQAAAQADLDHEGVGRVDAAAPERARQQREPHVRPDRPAAQRPAGRDDQADERERARATSSTAAASRSSSRTRRSTWTWVDGGITAEDDWEGAGRR